MKNVSRGAGTGQLSERLGLERPAAGCQLGRARHGVALGLCLAISLAAVDAEALSIRLDYSFDDLGFFDDPVRRTVLEVAADVFAGRIQDTLTPIIPGGGNQFSARFMNPATRTTAVVDNFFVSQDEIVVFVGGFAGGAGTSVLASAGGGGFSAGGSQAFLDNVIARGQLGALAPVPTDYAIWGGSMTFNIDKPWHFDTDPNTFESFDGLADFYSVAVHELAHVIGFGQAESWDALIVDNAFTGTDSQEVFGGPVPLFRGDLAHWAEGTKGTVDGVPQEASMDPTIGRGERKHLTDLDWAALADIGWEISDLVITPPPPATPPPIIGLPNFSLSGLNLPSFGSGVPIGGGVSIGGGVPIGGGGSTIGLPGFGGFTPIGSSGSSSFLPLGNLNPGGSLGFPTAFSPLFLRDAGGPGPQVISAPATPLLLATGIGLLGLAACATARRPARPAC